MDRLLKERPPGGNNKRLRRSHDRLIECITYSQRASAKSAKLMDNDELESDGSDNEKENVDNLDEEYRIQCNKYFRYLYTF